MLEKNMSYLEKLRLSLIMQEKLNFKEELSYCKDISTSRILCKMSEGNVT